MWKFLKNKLKEIQTSDQKTKKRWLAATTALAMIVVITLWVIYINKIMLPSNEPAPDTSVGNWQVFKTGVGVLFESIKKGLGDLVSWVTSSRTITVQK